MLSYLKILQILKQKLQILKLRPRNYRILEVR